MVLIVAAIVALSSAPSTHADNAHFLHRFSDGTTIELVAVTRDGFKTTSSPTGKATKIEDGARLLESIQSSNLPRPQFILRATLPHSASPGFWPSINGDGLIAPSHPGDDRTWNCLRDLPVKTGAALCDVPVKVALTDWKVFTTATYSKGLRTSGTLFSRQLGTDTTVTFTTTKALQNQDIKLIAWDKEGKRYEETMRGCFDVKPENIVKIQLLARPFSRFTFTGVVAPTG